jgi:hypothetical protein
MQSAQRSFGALVGDPAVGADAPDTRVRIPVMVTGSSDLS